jgi:hypothetical protein
MSRWSVALFAVVIGVAVASPALADFSLVRWSWGDCRIWNNGPRNSPAGVRGRDWVVLVPHIPSVQQAWGALNKAAQKRQCARTWVAAR